MINILAFSGSTRSGSYNTKILGLAVEGAKDAGANVTVIKLLDYELPLYDGDIESRDGLPMNCLKLKQLFINNQGLLLALPEYNSSISAVFKNMIDWVSRPTQDEAEPLSCFKNKTAALMSASIGKLGGMRGLVHARSMFENINVMVIPNQICISNADTAFDERGVLKEKKSTQSLEKLGFELANLIKKIHIIPIPMQKPNGIDSSPVKPLASKEDKELIQDFENEGGGGGINLNL
jgi:NAD(P)H-dependent FMN reductase